MGSIEVRPELPVHDLLEDAFGRALQLDLVAGFVADVSIALSFAEAGREVLVIILVDGTLSGGVSYKL